MEEASYKKRARVDSAELESEFDFDFDSTKAKRIRDDLLSWLDDSDAVPDRDSMSHDLDSVIRSFEEEIGSSESRSSPTNIIDLTSDSGDLLPELGEFAGDGVEILTEKENRSSEGVKMDELVRVSTESSRFGEVWDFLDDFPSYDTFGIGLGYEQETEFVTLDGIFDYSDINLSWRPDTLPA
ncbi:uncharacterized protein LOC130807470 [Amaranthus tricolor]|uniref:uncharacterized protein LOC130807470 n=1 Tax=Amaranthus tricolor TaxID=29722 RepID=UPI00258F88FD|nr:uncharacterized protein LOC130807470 [Amaranthus tricolor]